MATITEKTKIDKLQAELAELKAKLASAHEELEQLKLSKKADLAQAALDGYETGVANTELKLFDLQNDITKALTKFESRMTHAEVAKVIEQASKQESVQPKLSVVQSTAQKKLDAHDEKLAIENTLWVEGNS